jgi:quercetin dioxygenase-like cupin family protein
MSDPYRIHTDLTALFPDLPVDSILSRTLHENDHMKVILFEFAEGQALSEHSVSQHATLQFLLGEAQLALGDDTHTAKAGTWVYMPPHLAHSILAHKPCMMVLTMLKDPK